MRHAILVVDDDDSTRAILCELLQAEGYVAVSAGNGAEAVRRMVELRPCVVLLDFTMPVMDGHDFREVQKRIAPEVPIICLTGAADAEQTARLVGASSVLTKPLDLDALVRSVAELCSRPHPHREDIGGEAAATPQPGVQR